ncbi:MAG: hypothetical protein WC263_00425, partial [Candidatus Micrarchaeia archaeon]
AKRIASYSAGSDGPRLAEVVDKAAKYYNIDPNLVWAVIFKESSGKYYSVEATRHDGTNYYLEPLISPDSISLTQCHNFDLKMPSGASSEAKYLASIVAKGEYGETYLFSAAADKTSFAKAVKEYAAKNSGKIGNAGEFSAKVAKEAWGMLDKPGGWASVDGFVIKKENGKLNVYEPIKMGAYLKNAIKSKDSELLARFDSAKSLGELGAKLAKCSRPMFICNDDQVGIVLNSQVKDGSGIYDNLLRLGRGKGMAVSGLNGTQFSVVKYYSHEYDKYSISGSKGKQQYAVFETIRLSKDDKDALSKLKAGGQRIISNSNGSYAFLVEKGIDGSYAIYNFRKRIAPGEEIGGAMNQDYAIVKAAARIRSHIDRYGDISLIYPAYTGGEGMANTLAKAKDFGDVAKNTFTFLRIYQELSKSDFHASMLKNGVPGVEAACSRIAQIGGFVNDSRPLYGFNFERQPGYNSSRGAKAAGIAMK